MGADFICGVIAIKKNKVPNFEKAKSVLDKMKDEALEELVRQYTGEFNQYEVDPTDDESGKPVDLEAARKLLYNALDTVREGWAGHHRGFCCFDHLPLNATLLVSGDRTWGDPVEDVSAMDLFVASGMAKAAGFLV